jgi:hypothetical protein
MSSTRGRGRDRGGGGDLGYHLDEEAETRGPVARFLSPSGDLTSLCGGGVGSFFLIYCS